MKTKDSIWFTLLILFWIFVALLLVFLPGGGKIPEPAPRDFIEVEPAYKEYAIVQTVEKEQTVDQSELECLALNIYHEARNQGKIGMLLVGHVTINRVESNRYPDGICDVVYQPKQFSWTHRRKDHTPHEIEMWNKSLKAAEMVMNRDFDRSQGALFYYNPSLANPAWAKKMRVVITEKDHVFLVNN